MHEPLKESNWVVLYGREENILCQPVKTTFFCKLALSRSVGYEYDCGEDYFKKILEI